MKTARETISIFTSHNALKRLLIEYDNLDTARRLCADYCITGDEVARLIDGIPKPKIKLSKSRLTFVVRSDKTIDEGYLLAR
jgi:hypothetical protein